MIPPLVYRCPRCGHVGWCRRFAVVGEDGTEAVSAAEDGTEAATTAEVGTAAGGRGSRTVECPACRFRFEPFDNPWLK